MLGSCNVCRYILLAFILILGISCKGKKPSSDFHPDLGFYFSVYDEVLVKSDFNDINIFEDHFTVSIVKISDRSIDFSDYYISDISEILISDSLIFVLDQRSVKVHKINLDTRKSSVITRSGRGPGEIVSPTSIQILGDTLIVADRVNGFTYHHLDGTHINDVRPDILPDFYCKVSDLGILKSGYVVYNGELQNNIIYVLDDKYNIINRFGERYSHDNVSLSAQLSFGKVLCVESKSIVVNTYSFGTPIVEVYDISNNTLKVLYLDGIKSTGFKMENNTPVFLGSQFDSLVHLYKSANILNDRFIVIQYQISESGKLVEDTILSYIYCLENEIFYISYQLPEIKSTNDNIILTKNYPDNYELNFFTVNVKNN